MHTNRLTVDCACLPVQSLSFYMNPDKSPKTFFVFTFAERKSLHVKTQVTKWGMQVKWNSFTQEYQVPGFSLLSYFSHGSTFSTKLYNKIFGINNLLTKFYSFFSFEYSANKQARNKGNSASMHAVYYAGKKQIKW